MILVIFYQGPWNALFWWWLHAKQSNKTKWRITPMLCFLGKETHFIAEPWRIEKNNSLAVNGKPKCACSVSWKLVPWFFNETKFDLYLFVCLTLGSNHLVSLWTYWKIKNANEPRKIRPSNFFSKIVCHT